MSKIAYILDSFAGRILKLDLGTNEISTIVDNHRVFPDGIIVIDDQIYLSNMGPHIDPDSPQFFQADGSIEVMNLDGSNRKTIVGDGLFVTGKQITYDAQRSQLYWCDREGLRVFRANLDGSNVQVLVQNGIFPRDCRNYSDQCVGIAVTADRMFWTQKGPPKGNQGRIFTAPTQVSFDSPRNRSDIQVLLADLPEPIDLSLSKDAQTLYWTDRGDPAKGGDSFNCAQLETHGTQLKLVNHQILAQGFSEPIGLCIDEISRTAYIAGLSGSVYSVSLDRPTTPRALASGLGHLTGIVLQ